MVGKNLNWGAPGPLVVNIDIIVNYTQYLNCWGDGGGTRPPIES